MRWTLRCPGVEGRQWLYHELREYTKVITRSYRETCIIDASAKSPGTRIKLQATADLAPAMTIICLFFPVKRAMSLMNA